MSQLYVPVILRNAREYVLVQHGHLDVDAMHTYETTEALIDTGALHVVVPPSVAEHLGLWRMGYTGAKMADGRTEEVPVTEPLYVELLGRTTTTHALILGGYRAHRGARPGRPGPGGRLPPGPAHAESRDARSTVISCLEMRNGHHGQTPSLADRRPPVALNRSLDDTLTD